MAASNKKPAKKSKYTDILYEVKDQVAWITINRPRVLNCFREQSLDEMIDALKSTREDPSIVCAVITGAGNQSFSAGGDFYAMKRLNFNNAYMWNDRMLGLAMTIRGLPIPVIAMINGWCMGGGHELALWCDLAIASENAVLGQTGAKVGACPTVGATQYIPRIIGERLAREMIFCARRFGAKEAAEVGLEFLHATCVGQALGRTRRQGSSLYPRRRFARVQCGIPPVETSPLPYQRRCRPGV